MSRPSEIDTKTVSVRLPMASYIRILQEAVGRNLSLSEYLTLKILGSPGGHVSTMLATSEANSQGAVDQPAELPVEAPKLPRVAAEKKKRQSAPKKKIEAVAVALKPEPPMEPARPTVSISEQRRVLKTRLATLNRRISSYEKHSNTRMLGKLIPERKQVLAELAGIKGKRDSKPWIEYHVVKQEPVKEEPAAPAEPTIAEQRFALKKRLATLNRRIGAHKWNVTMKGPNMPVINQLTPERDQIEAELASIKGRRK